MQEALLANNQFAILSIQAECDFTGMWACNASLILPTFFKLR